MTLSPVSTTRSLPSPETKESGFLAFRKPLLTSAFRDGSVIRSSSKAGAHSHLDLAWAVALGFGGTPVRGALEAETGLGEIKMVHHVSEDSSELHAYLFVDNEPFLDAQIQVEVSQAADPAATAASAIETEQQGTNAVIDRNRVTEEVDVALCGGSDRNPIRICASRDITKGLRTTERGRGRENAVLIAVSKSGAIFTAKILTIVVGDALKRLTRTRS